MSTKTLSELLDSLPRGHQVRAAHASTEWPNTPETDAMPQVSHLVTCFASDGSSEPVTVSLMAECPMSAIDRVNAALRANALET